jgi:predicted Zn finger-like uncharacterized protein
MALATRCPKCGTAFRVVRDQIKLREGWVRCGVCSTPFDSHASLIEIDVPAAATPAEPPVAAQVPVAEPHSAQPAPPAPDPIEDHPAVLRTRVPRPAGPADGNAPAASAPGFPGAGIELPRDDEARFGPVPDLYPALDAARRAGLVVEPRSAAPAFVPAAPVSAPAPFVPAPTFRADTEAASAAHLRAALGQGGAAASGRTEPSVWAGESGASAHTALRESEPSLRANEPTFDPQIASLRANAPLFEPRTTSPRTSDPVSRQVEPTFGPIVSPTPDAAASTSPEAPAEPRLRATEPTFTMPPLPRDDREPHFVVDDISDDDADATTPAHAADATTPSSPGFMATADDEPSRWRWVWIVLAVLAVMALLGQSIWIYRTELATWFPSMRPALEKACVQLDCTVGYPRDPRQLTIESSALETWTPEAANAGDGASPSSTGAAAGTSDTVTIGPSATSSATPGVRHLALRVTLRNRAKHPQAWPALELSLTDFSDTVVARRVLLPSTYLPPQQLADPIPAGQERSLRIPIDTTEARASGYRVAAFFP